MKKLAVLWLVIWTFGFVALGQNPQSSSAPLFKVNSTYVNGIAPGFAPCYNAMSSCSSTTGLNLFIGPGTVNCSATIQHFTAETLVMTANATNYVYLNTASGCAPAVKTSVFTTADIPIAVVVTGASTVNSLDDDRSSPTVPPAAGAITQLTGDATAGPGSGSQIITFATVNGSPGTCGNSTNVAQVNVNAKGLVTSCTLVGISATGIGAVPTTTTVNGHALSSNVTISASDLMTGTLAVGNGGTGATTAAGANLAITGTTQTGTLGTSSQVSAFPGSSQLNASGLTNTQPSNTFNSIFGPAVSGISPIPQGQLLDWFGYVAAGGAWNPQRLTYIPAYQQGNTLWGLIDSNGKKKFKFDDSGNYLGTVIIVPNIYVPQIATPASAPTAVPTGSGATSYIYAVSICQGPQSLCPNPLGYGHTAVSPSSTPITNASTLSSLVFNIVNLPAATDYNSWCTIWRSTNAGLSWGYVAPAYQCGGQFVDTDNSPSAGTPPATNTTGTLNASNSVITPLVTTFQIGGAYYVDGAPTSCTTNEGSFTDQVACAHYLAYDAAVSTGNSQEVIVNGEFTTTAELIEPEVNVGNSTPSVNYVGCGLGGNRQGTTTECAGITLIASQPYLLYKLGTYPSATQISGVAFHGNHMATTGVVSLSNLGSGCKIGNVSVEGSMGSGFNSAHGYLQGDTCNISGDFVSNDPYSYNSFSRYNAAFSVSVSGGVPTVALLSTCNSSYVTPGSGSSVCGGKYGNAGPESIFFTGSTVVAHSDGVSCTDPGLYQLLLTQVGTDPTSGAPYYTGTSISVVRAASGCAPTMQAQAIDVAPVQYGWNISLSDTQFSNLSVSAVGQEIYGQMDVTSCAINSSGVVTLVGSDHTGAFYAGSSLHVFAGTLSGSCGTPINGQTLSITSWNPSTNTLVLASGLSALSSTSTTGSVNHFEWGCGAKVNSSVWDYIHTYLTPCGTRFTGRPMVTGYSVDSPYAYGAILNGVTTVTNFTQTWNQTGFNPYGSRSFYQENTAVNSSLAYGTCGSLQNAGAYNLVINPFGSEVEGIPANNGNNMFLTSVRDCSTGNLAPNMGNNPTLSTIVQPVMGTALAATGVTASTNWGTTGAAGNGIGTVSGYSQQFAFTLTTPGSGQGANPTIAIVFPNSLTVAPAYCHADIWVNGGSSVNMNPSGKSTTGVTFTFIGTPAASTAYLVQGFCM